MGPAWKTLELALFSVVCESRAGLEGSIAFGFDFKTKSNNSHLAIDKLSSFCSPPR